MAYVITAIVSLSVGIAVGFITRQKLIGDAQKILAVAEEQLKSAKL